MHRRLFVPISIVLVSLPLLADEKEKPKWDVSNPPGPRHDVTIDVDEGTWLNVDANFAHARPSTSSPHEHFPPGIDPNFKFSISISRFIHSDPWFTCSHTVEPARLRAMPLVIREIHASPRKEALNDEWFVVENTGDRAFSTAGCSVATGKGKGRLRPVGTLDPGFTIGPSEKVRLITGNPGRKAHGAVPAEADGVKNYHLFLATPLVGGAGSVLAVALHQHELCRAVFDPGVPTGVGAPADGE